MIKTSTQNELIQYVYDELPDLARTQLEAVLMHDNELAESCSELLEMQFILQNEVKSPSARAISNILNYSKSFSLQS